MERLIGLRQVSLPRWCDAVLAAVLLVSLAVLLAGWIGGSDVAVRLWPSYAAMVPSTAALFALSAAALLAYLRSRVRSATLRAVAVFVIAVSALDLLLIASGTSNGLDALLWPDRAAFVEDRMALATALCFVLLGISLFTMTSVASRHPLFVTATTLGWSLAMVALIGYIFAAEQLYTVSLFTAMALHTSLCFVALFSVALFARSDRGWMRIVMGRGEGSRGARRLLPFVILVPFLLCLLALLGTRAGWYGPDFRLSLLAILIITLMTATVLRNAVLENRSHAKLVATVRRLESSSEERGLLLREVYHRVKNNLQQMNALIQIEARAMPAECRPHFETLGGRVRALGKVHELLMSRATPSSIGLANFLTELCHSLLEGIVTETSEIDCKIDVEDREVDIDFAVTMGLLTNELVAGSIAHALTDGHDRRIEIGCRSDDKGDLILRVSDNGDAGPRAGAPGMAEGTGSRIVGALVESLDGRIEVAEGDGMTVEVSIPQERIA